MLDKIFRIATRDSPLAMWQAKYVQNLLMKIYSNLQIELVPIITKGDIIRDNLEKLNGKRLFVKELELAILDNRADLAVHSMKDVPIHFQEGLGLVTICKREDPHDAFISNYYNSINELPHGAIIGTSSLRRQCQIKAYLPNVVIRSLRGNIGTRLNKLDAGEYDAIILAAAGLKRLGLKNRILHLIPTKILLPAAGQGAIGIECRLNDKKLITLLKVLNHSDTAICVNAERAMNTHLKGSCQAPIGSFAILKNKQLWLRALVGSSDGKQIVIGERRGPPNKAEQIGISLAKDLLARGAESILHTVS